jgi:predicted nucleic acid-binding protein
MIVVDTNIISYFYLPTEKTTEVERLLIQNPEWAVPILWRSEFRNVLGLYLPKNWV